MAKQSGKSPEKQTKTEPKTVSATYTIFGKKVSFSNEDKICTVLLLALFLLIISIRTKFSLIPFERDEGIYGYMGKLLLDGGIPYKDFQEQKFPGLFYFYGLMVYLFGDTVKGLHTGFMYLNIITTLVLYLASRKLFSPIAGIITAITFAFVSLTPNLSGFTVQAEHGVAFFISLGLFFYALYFQKKKWYYNFAMGLAFGCAIMTKTSGVFLVLWGGVVLITDFLFTKDKKFIDLVKQVSIYSAAVFSVVGVLFLIIYLKGSFDEMMFWAYEIPKNYVSKIKFEDGIKYFGYSRDAIVENYKFFWVHAFFVIVVALFTSIPVRIRVAAVLLLFFSCCTIVPGFYFYGHYWIQIIPGLALVSGISYFGIMHFLKTKLNMKKEIIPYVYLAVFILFTFKHLNASKSYYFHPNYERILRSVYGNNPFPESMEIANFINANSKPEDDIVLIGSEPQIYFYTKKKCASRFAYFAALVDNVPQHKEWQREFVAAVEKQKPRYLVFFNHGISLFVQPNTDQYIFEWTNKYVTENFVLVGVADMVEGQQTTYVWKEALANYQPKGGSIIYVYERKPSQN